MMDNNQIISNQKSNDNTKIPLESITKQSVKIEIIPNLCNILKIFENSTPKSHGMLPPVNSQHPCSFLCNYKNRTHHLASSLSLLLLFMHGILTLRAAFPPLFSRLFLSCCWHTHPHNSPLISPIYLISAFLNN